MCPVRIDQLPRLQLRESLVELRPNPFFEGWSGDQVLTEADRAVRRLEEQRRFEERQIKIWGAEIRLNELQAQLDGLDES